MFYLEDTRIEPGLCRPNEEVLLKDNTFVMTPRTICQGNYAFLGGISGQSLGELNKKVGVAFIDNELIYDTLEGHLRRGRVLLMVHFVTKTIETPSSVFIRTSHLFSEVTLGNFTRKSEELDLSPPISSAGRVERWYLDPINQVYLCEKPDPLLLSRFRFDFQVQWPQTV